MNSNNKIVRNYTQTLAGNKNEIFPLLCPVREKEWLPGWDYEIVFSESGYCEMGCIFETNNDYGKYHWVTSIHDKALGKIQFVKSTEMEDVIIDIELDEESNNLSYCNIKYTFIPLKTGEAELETFRKNNSQENFNFHMNKWEISLNYFLENGKMITG